MKKNYCYRLLYELLVTAVPLITTPYISRVIGADGVGEYSYTYSIVSLFMLIGCLGTTSYGTREIARNRDSKTMISKLFWELELVSFITTGTCLILWIILICMKTVHAKYFIALTPFLIGVVFDISWFFIGLEQVGRLVLRNAIVKILNMVLVFSLIRSSHDILLYCVINGMTVLVGNASMWLYLPRMLTPINYKELEVYHHVKSSFLYFMPTVATSVYTVLDKTLIGYITKDAYQNGFYEQATKIINILKTFVFTAVNSIMTARMSYLFAKGMVDEAKEMTRKTMDFIALLGVGVTFGIVGIAHTFVPIFFGPGYSEVEWLIYMMSPLVIIIGLSNCLGSHYYTPIGKRTQSTKYLVYGAIGNLIFNIILIPKLKSYGATIASVIGELLISALYIRNCDQFLNVHTIAKIFWKRFLAGGLMCAVVVMFGMVLGQSFWGLLIQIVIGVTIYGILLCVLRDKMLLEFVGIVRQHIKGV